MITGLKSLPRSTIAGPIENIGKLCLFKFMGISLKIPYLSHQTAGVDSLLTLNTEFDTLSIQMASASPPPSKAGENFFRTPFS